jgi:type I restriction enzyme, S subunit
MKTLPWENYSPDNWEIWRLKFAAPLKTERGNQDAQVPEYLGLENVESWTGKLVLSSLNSDLNDDKDNLQINGIAFNSSHVLFGKLRPYLAKVFLPETSGICSTEFLVLEPIEKINRKYLFYTLLTKEFIATINASTFGSKMPRANWDFIGSQSIPVPPISDQDKIVNYLDRETAEIDALISEKERSIALLKERRSALITAAVTGQIGLEEMTS